MNTYYEWDYETVNDDGEIEDHNHSGCLSSYIGSDKTNTLVLVRNTGSENEGLTDRSWAYVENGKLPEYFKDARGCETYKVPKRFHAELTKYLKTT